jgi:hypothetical protein
MAEGKHWTAYKIVIDDEDNFSTFSIISVYYNMKVVVS